MDLVERQILDAVDQRKDELFGFAEDLYRHAEPGFREVRTSALFAQKMEQLGLAVERNLAVTGVKARLLPSKPGAFPVCAALGELDGIRCPGHRYADPQTGLSHTCGHHLQMTALLGAAIALSHPDVRKHLCGEAVFFAVPSEEFSDLDYKLGLMERGVIQYGGGKSELIRAGAFDDVDLCVNHHLHMVPTQSDILLGNNTTNGFVIKNVRFVGKSSHAAIAPWDGVNALNAASLAYSALQYQRETFRDEDRVRMHAILTKGGDMVNVIPQESGMEVQIRAKTMEGMLDAARKADRCFQAGALAMGGQALVNTLPGYLPIPPASVDPALRQAAEALDGISSSACIDPAVHNPASTDVGDLAHLMPVLGFTTGGFRGALHSADFSIADRELACLIPAKMMALTLYHLLKDGAAGAKHTIAGFVPQLGRQEYFSYMDSFHRTGKQTKESHHKE